MEILKEVQAIDACKTTYRLQQSRAFFHGSVWRLGGAAGGSGAGPHVLKRYLSAFSAVFPTVAGALDLINAMLPGSAS